MITAEAARAIADSKIISEKTSPDFKLRKAFGKESV